MGAEEEAKKDEVESASEATPPPPPPPPPPAEAVKDVAEEKAVDAPPATEEKPDESKAIVVVEKVEDKPAEKSSGGSADRDAALTRVATEKRLSLIRAWEDNEKTKAENKSVKKLSAITAWENSKKASVEADLKKKEEELEKQKAEYAEKIKNKIALLHKAGEEKRAIVEAQRGEEVLKAEEMAAKYRATGLAPKKLLGCFGA